MQRLIGALNREPSKRTPQAPRRLGGQQNMQQPAFGGQPVSRGPVTPAENKPFQPVFPQPQPQTPPQQPVYGQPLQKPQQAGMQPPQFFQPAAQPEQMVNTQVMPQEQLQQGAMGQVANAPQGLQPYQPQAYQPQVYQPYFRKFGM